MPQTIELIGNRWSASALAAAFLGARRFTDMLVMMGAPPTIVSDRLHTVRQMGVLETVAGPGSGRVEYRLTDKGRAFFPHIMVALDWGDRWFRAPEGPAMLLTHTGCGGPFRPVLRCGVCDRELHGSQIQAGGDPPQASAPAPPDGTPPQTTSAPPRRTAAEGFWHDRGVPDWPGLPIPGDGLTMKRKRQADHRGEMPVGSIERELQVACASLSAAVATVRYDHEHYLDGPAAPRAGPEDPFRAVTVLAAAHPWALAGFGEAAWDAYQPDPDAPAPEGLRVGVLSLADHAGPPLPAVARFARHGHLLITESGFVPGARSLLQALALRLATAAGPGTVRFALADPVGQGQHLSAFLRLPAPMRVGGWGRGQPGGDRGPADHADRLRRGGDPDPADQRVRLGGGLQRGHHRGGDSVSRPGPGRLARRDQRPGRGAARPARPQRAPGRPVPPRHRRPEAPAAAGLRPGGAGRAGHDRGPGLPRRSVLGRPGVRAERDRAGPDAAGRPGESLARRGGRRRQPGVAGSAFRPDRDPAAAALGRVSTDGLDVQIGVDSKGEPQHFVMGVRGVHHGMVGGDVRMGKTNLLHVLISQLALTYPPEELELYLLDFKEVEFDAYLTERLPHARAITSRTDREFGLSMLRRFHDEIDRRARLCREAKVTDLPDYRTETGQVLPRALVIMDEFQVLFSEEDRLAREAAGCWPTSPSAARRSGCTCCSPPSPRAGRSPRTCGRSTSRWRCGSPWAVPSRACPRPSWARATTPPPSWSGPGTRSTTTAAARAPTR